ncbi:MAG: HypC/HybG/HupF family hydrogenase formation chaperone [Candidatus Omnitrophota bacterium]
MCLAIPMKIKSINGAFAEVTAAKLVRRVNIEMVSNIKVGDYVIVHAGFAIEKVNPQKAEETLRLIEDEIHRRIP